MCRMCKAYDQTNLIQRWRLIQFHRPQYHPKAEQIATTTIIILLITIIIGKMLQSDGMNGFCRQNLEENDYNV